MMSIHVNFREIPNDYEKTFSGIQISYRRSTRIIVFEIEIIIFFKAQFFELVF